VRSVKSECRSGSYKPQARVHGQLGTIQLRSGSKATTAIWPLFHSLFDTISSRWCWILVDLATIRQTRHLAKVYLQRGGCDARKSKSWQAFNVTARNCSQSRDLQGWEHPRGVWKRRDATSASTRRPEWLGAAPAAPQARLPFRRNSDKSQGYGDRIPM